MSLLSKLKELGKDTSIYGMSKVLSQLLNFILVPIYTGYLSPSDYGILAMTTLYSSLFTPVVNMGLTSAVFRFMTYTETDEERKQIISTGHIAVISLALMGLALSLLFLPHINAILLNKDIPTSYLSIAVFTAFFSAIDAMPLAILRIERKAKKVATISLVNLMLSMGTTILLVIVFKFGVYGSLYGLLIANVMTAIYMFSQVTRPNFRYFSWAELKRMLGFGLPAVPHHLQAIGMSMYGQFMVKTMLSIEQAGLYNIAWKFTMPLVMITNAVQQSWGPYKFHLHKSEGEKAAFTFGSIFNYYLAAILFVFTMMALWMPYVFVWSVNSKFYEAASLLVYLSLIPICTGLYWMLGTGIELGKSMKLLPFISFSGFMVTFLTAALFINKFGTAGAGIATSCGWLTMAVLVYFYAQSIFKVAYDWLSVLACLLVAAAVIFANNYWASDLGIWPKFGLRLLLSIGFVLGIAIVFFRNKSESARMRQALNVLKNRKKKNKNVA
ncbi:Membrane protein involved in the export of O-antigen and teichoic acid [Flexibacter flexilis DSM 6793]|uniref:Membrane protein involved in the export of O-antigen and teichoic acid n=1 Tax=Flexibacter flexilis DSM 6793 TaxID=927664 RepID=A0A1I1FRB4_9BACT|nr:oligosaccharide flippase family protein [Flexibacter flexilis]SFB99633.1 Membrane protein involved in the export of O-antigen and teichoic acid [Flexibacter flexilis DSM 6793]